MKSLVQEASTIAKAIEQGWKEAGEPREFSVKVLEEPQRNFLGLTTRSAKIALLFSEYQPKEQPKKAKTVPPKRQQHTARPLQQKESVTPTKAPAPQKATKKSDSLWGDDLVEYAKNWLTRTLDLMNRKDVSFTVTPQNFYLRITFKKPLLDDETKEKHLLASISLLMLATVKKHFRKALRGHKIVLTHEA